MTRCLFVSDLHGNISKYEKLVAKIETDKPDIVLFGGDLTPNPSKRLPDNIRDFFNDYFIPLFKHLRSKLKKHYPEMLIILGNDDDRTLENEFIRKQKMGLWKYMHKNRFNYKEFSFFGYSHVPPTPFLYKDWERYDLSRYVDPGCIPPAEGYHTIDSGEDIEFITIQSELESLTGDTDLSKSIFLFHSPPYQTNLDRAALDGIKYDHVPLDVNVGSIAIKKFIENRQPWLTLHGHIHESTRITGEWKEQTGKCLSFNAAHDGTELSVISFELEDVANAKRILI
ncbi:MAG: metallophosphoesterase [Bacteroidota bacterium]